MPSFSSGYYYKAVCGVFFGSHSFPGQSLLLSSTILNDYWFKLLVIAEQFYALVKAGDRQSISKYTAKLRRLATHCEFGAYLNDAL